MRFILSLGAATILLLSSTVHATPVYWDVTYYTDGEAVGNGYFGYDTDTSTTVLNALDEKNGFPSEYNQYITVDNQDYFDASATQEEIRNYEITTAVEDSHWEVYGKAVEIDDQWNTQGVYWLPDVDNGVVAGRTSPYESTAPSYIAKDWDVMNGALESYYNSSSSLSQDHWWNKMTWEDYSSNTEATGSWTVGALEGELVSNNYTGTFVATLRDSVVPAVPIPATLPLFALGLLGLGFLARKNTSV